MMVASIRRLVQPVFSHEFTQLTEKGTPMSCFFRTGLLATLALPLLLAPASQAQYAEDFTTTTYEDTLSTSADWNTTDGELKLFPFVPTLAGSYDTPGQAWKVAVAGDHVYVADDANG
ncbi:MAG: hypothetical protein GY723_14205, partial [bacterium]|nr:hypothetical protein [bacterium]